jgi:hypothetical protein
LSIPESILLRQLEKEVAELTQRLTAIEQSSAGEAIKRLWDLESSQRNLKTWVTGRMNKWGEKINKLKDRELEDFNGENG